MPPPAAGEMGIKDQVQVQVRGLPASYSSQVSQWWQGFQSGRRVAAGSASMLVTPGVGPLPGLCSDASRDR